MHGLDVKCHFNNAHLKNNVFYPKIVKGIKLNEQVKNVALCVVSF